MARPVVSATTERLYGSLPSFYREDDEVLDFPLLRYLSLLGDQMGEIETLFDRFDYDDADPEDTSDLSDPLKADARWLPWLGQLLGVDVELLKAEGDRRQALANPQSGWQRGSTSSVIAAAQSVLTGDQKVVLRRHVNGNWWHVEIRTRWSETGFLTWQGLESSYANWDDIEQEGSWFGLEPRSVELALRERRVKPAGVKLEHIIGTGTWAEVEALGNWNEIQGEWSRLESL